MHHAWPRRHTPPPCRPRRPPCGGAPARCPGSLVGISKERRLSDVVLIVNISFSQCRRTLLSRYTFSVLFRPLVCTCKWNTPFPNQCKYEVCISNVFFKSQGDFLHLGPNLAPQTCPVPAQPRHRVLVPSAGGHSAEDPGLRALASLSLGRVRPRLSGSANAPSQRRSTVVSVSF